MRYVLSLLVVALSYTSAQGIYDNELKEVIQDPQVVLEHISAAQQNIFIITPQLGSTTLKKVLDETSQRGVPVYLILQEGEARPSFSESNVQIRTLPVVEEGFLMIDASVLIAGGLISGTGDETIQLERAVFGDGPIEQLRAIWGAASQ